MGVLFLDPVEVENTWTAIHGRIAKVPQFQVLPQDAFETIEEIIMASHAEAFDHWDSYSEEHRKYRAQFWKNRVLAAVEPEKRGLYAVYFHEYVAASTRGDAAEMEDEPMTIPSYGGHARAAHDAYIACIVSLL